MSDRAAHSVSGTPRRARAKRDEKAGARSFTLSNTLHTEERDLPRPHRPATHSVFSPKQKQRCRLCSSSRRARPRGLPRSPSPRSSACAWRSRAPLSARRSCRCGSFFWLLWQRESSSARRWPPPRAKKHSRDERGDSAPGAPPTRLIGVPEHMSLLRRAVYGALAWHSDLANGRALHEQQKSWRAQCCVWQQRSVFADMLDTQNSCILSDRCTPQRSL